MDDNGPMRPEFDGMAVFPRTMLAPFGRTEIVKLKSGRAPAYKHRFASTWLRYLKWRHRNISCDVICHWTVPLTAILSSRCMTDDPPRYAGFAPRILALASLALLGGCIDSTLPILINAQPLAGERPRLEFYALRDGTAHEPSAETFAWRGGRYVPIRGTATDIGDFTLHAFEGADLIVQSIRSGKPAEYAIARKLADGTYLIVAIDENDADEATRGKFCGHDAGAACRVTTREAVLAFARATAAKPHATGGLAVPMAEQ
jgi:hypothetical protein